MNGEYVLSLTPGGAAAANKFPLNFKDYPGGVEYFDVYTPMISTLYSQVFWTGLDPVDLPADIVKRYAGRGMAVVGFEVDQVRRTPDGDVSLPITLAYNHHFEAGMSGAKSRFEKVKFSGPNDPRIAKLEREMGHGLPNHDEHWMLTDLDSESPIPSSQAFGGGNGGEYRKSFHGYPPGYAQVILSPERFQMTPMQIDTFNRDEMNLTSSHFVTGPVPRNSWAPKAGSPDSKYSGLLECPVTTRLQAVIDANYVAQVADKCANPIGSSHECFGAATQFIGASGNTFDNFEISNTSMPAGCSVTNDPQNSLNYFVYFNSAASSTACGGSNVVLSGATASLVNLQVNMDSEKDLVTISMTGPSSVWYGVGFGAQAMKDAPWAIIADGSGKVEEYKLSDQGTANKLLTPSLTVKSNTVANGNRTIVVTRSLKGAGPEYYTFDTSKSSVLPFINAIGNTPQLAFHKAKLPTQISIVSSGINISGSCLCAVDPPPFGSGKGKFVYHPVNQPGEKGQGTISFGNHCAEGGDLMIERNPTCDVRYYVGGQTACHHMFSLLDADQEIPWVDQPLEYQHKWRFWVQPYNESYHKNVRRTTWGIGSPVEYDVPKCSEGVRGCAKDETGRWVHTIRGTYGAEGNIVAGHFHCHAPTCKYMSMYTCPDNVTVCNETTGTLICTERPIYGGTGQIDQKRFDEPGYILQPPCMFGDAEFGLQAPVAATKQMFTIKGSYADYGHHGEMAWQQMYIV